MFLPKRVFCVCFVLGLCVLVCLVACRQDIGLLLRDKQISGNSGEMPRLLQVMPADDADGIGTNTKISLVFSTGMAPDSVQVSTGGSACSGTIQVSADNFTTCVAMSGQPSNTDAGTNFALTPAAPLTANTLYKTRVTTGLRSADNNYLASAYTTGSGFRTGPGADTRAPIGPQAAGFIVPYDAAAAVGINTRVLLYFLEPPLPATVSANTADSQCSGSVRLSKDNFASCVRFRARPVISTSGKNYTLIPAAQLEPGTAYKISVQNTVTDLAGNAFAAFTSTFTTATGVSPTPNSVAGVSPAENVTNISVNAYYQITFNRAIDPATLELNFLTTQCSGVIQVSMDGFNTCVPLSSRVLLSESFTDVYLYPQGSLATSTVYRIRVTSQLQDAFGESVSAFTQTNGFTTGNPAAPVVEHLIAFDGSSLGSLLAPFGVAFSKIMNPATITVNTANTNCLGGFSFQVSSDNFTTCLRMALVTANSSNARFFAYPALPLTANTVYKTRLTIGAQDALGNANTLFTGTGITTEP